MLTFALTDVNLAKIWPYVRVSGGSEMEDSTRRAQHYHDLALEFLVLTRITTAFDIRENYRMMGQHYLAKARAELAREKSMTSTTGLAASISTLRRSS